MKSKIALALIIASLPISLVFSQERKLKLIRDVMAISNLLIGKDTFLFHHQYHEETAKNVKEVKPDEVLISFSSWAHSPTEDLMKKTRDTTFTIPLKSTKELNDLLSINNYFQAEYEGDNEKKIKISLYTASTAMFVSFIYGHDEDPGLLLDYISKNYFNGSFKEVFEVLRSLSR